MSTSMQNQYGTLKQGVVANGATTASLELVTSVSGKKPRIILDQVSIGAAGRVWIAVANGAVAAGPLTYFPAAATLFPNLLVEGANSYNLTLEVILNAAASGDVPVEAMVRYESV